MAQFGTLSTDIQQIENLFCIGNYQVKGLMLVHCTGKQNHSTGQIASLGLMNQRTKGDIKLPGPSFECWPLSSPSAAAQQLQCTLVKISSMLMQ